MAEHLALAQDVGDVHPVHDLDGSGTHDVQEARGSARLGEDHRAGGEELDVGVPDHLREPVLVQLVERRIHLEERRDVHAGSIDRTPGTGNALGSRQTCPRADGLLYPHALHGA